MLNALLLSLAAAPTLLFAASSNSYGTTTVDCPVNEQPAIRDFQSLSADEKLWTQKRRANTIPALRDLIKRLDIADFDSDGYFDSAKNVSTLPNIGIALSGGGWRALMNGAGAIAAYDQRTPGSTGAGQLGGLLQSATYLTGLSGGGWLVSSLYANEFPSVQSIVDTRNSTSIWQFQNSIFEGPDMGDTGSSNAGAYFEAIVDQVAAKVDSGFNTTLTDFWGRALSFQLVDASGEIVSTFSSIQNMTGFPAAEHPLPILVADERQEGQSVLFSTNTTNYEFTPWELGSFDSIGFVPLQYVGSDFEAGNISSRGRCVTGFDQLSFVFGTSSSLFNQFLLQINSTDMVPTILKDSLTSILVDLDQTQMDVANWSPNPFYHWNNATNANSQTKQFTLVDGGEDLQNIPFTPLLQPAREVDVIFAVDSSADTLDREGPNWPNGTAMVATYERSLFQDDGTTFPPVPDVNTFINLGLNSRPTMFGCDAANLTANSTAPLVVYLPHSPYVFNSNVSTFTPSYQLDVRNAIIRNGYDVATRGNATVDAQWPTCVGCAIMSRSWDRTNTTVPGVCRDCFSKYCWDGATNSTTPGPYTPRMLLEAVKVEGIAGTIKPMSGLSIVATALALVILRL
ncbi:Lysophospholipase 1 [Colletotrichum siamense]|uniref:Lysophospholipase n=1 Tax=Colletotrichum siamense TaxID=690259 RepID=A0A9P5ES24_COLSI|nr:Lysophospholipase 1 [Colletotrichum siamense]KAF4858553.1 Lysophospholipase 1 [Colletotrichum siamense]